MRKAKLEEEAKSKAAKAAKRRLRSKFFTENERRLGVKFMLKAGVQHHTEMGSNEGKKAKEGARKQKL